MRSDEAHVPPAAQPAPDVRAGSGRIWEIDFLRGFSILLVLLYHAAYDLREIAGVQKLFGWEIPLYSPWLEALRNIFAGLFIVLCGISSTLTRSNVRRALRLLAVALVITAATYFFYPSEAVYFGILHCLGVSILLYALALKQAGPWACAAAAVVASLMSAALPLLLKNTVIPFDWLLPLGIHSRTYSSFDYFPLFPWLAVFLVGSALGKSIYASRRSLILKPPPVSVINIAGRHSLWIYVLHQPVILGVFYATGLMR